MIDIQRWLDEDIGWGDATSEAIVPPHQTCTASIMTKQAGVCAGLDVAIDIFSHTDRTLRFTRTTTDGAPIAIGQTIARIYGNTRAVLRAERLALNVLQRLSGIATQTKRYVDAVAVHGTRIALTRKTTPGLRMLERNAVRAGGGTVHRYGLCDAMLIKDNHIRAAGSIVNAIRLARAHASHMMTVAVEVDTFEQLHAVLAHTEHRVDCILLDNMDVDAVAHAVACIKEKRKDCTVEVSGGITLDNVAQYAATGCDIVSIGALTHSVRALDISLDIEETDV
jgi:nicotinate-nucleotide pyrophosphorylase (carboxylating)